MKAHLTTSKVSVYCTVKHQGEYFEASGSGKVYWELAVDHNNHEVFQIKVNVPDQTLKCHLWFLDNDGKEVELVDYDVELKDAQVKAKQLSLNSAILPTSIELNHESPVVAFS